MVQAHVATTASWEQHHLAGGALLAGHVEVADRAIISGNCVVHQFCRIGGFAMMRGLSRTSGTSPLLHHGRDPHRQGLNLVGLPQERFRPEAVRAIKNAFSVLFRSGLNMPNAVANGGGTGSDDDVRHLLDFIRGPSGGCVLEEGRQSAILTRGTDFFARRRKSSK